MKWIWAIASASVPLPAVGYEEGVSVEKYVCQINTFFPLGSRAVW